MTDGKASNTEKPSASAAVPGLKLVEAALARLRFGTILLTVHEGRLVQLDVTERTRFPS